MPTELPSGPSGPYHHTYAHLREPAEEATVARRRYTDEQRARALDLYREHGPAHASRETGVPVKTVASWARRAGAQTDAADRTSKATKAAAVSRADRAEKVAAAALADADVLRQLITETAREAAAAGDLRALVAAFDKLYAAGTDRLDAGQEVNGPASDADTAALRRALFHTVK